MKKEANRNRFVIEGTRLLWKIIWLIILFVIWIVCILLLLLSIEKSNRSAYEMLSGIEASGVRGAADYKAISQWICLALPLYLTTGFWLYQHQPVRKYLLIRCHNYRNWCFRMAAEIIDQIVGYHVIWGVILALVSVSPDAANIWKCLIFRMVCAVPVGMLLLIIWEFTQNAGSVLGVIFLEYAVIAASCLMPLKAQRYVLGFAGMYRYISGAKEYFGVLAVELLGSVLLFILAKQRARYMEP